MSSAGAHKDGSVLFGTFELRPAARLLLHDGAPVAVGGRAMDILLCLIQRPGEVVSAAELLASAWRGISVDPAALRVQVSALRRALGEGGSRYVSNVAGRGYCFVGQVQSKADTAEGEALQSPDVVRSLPMRPAGVVGRDGVVEDVLRLLERERFVTIVGAGGIGKTTVALIAAHMWSATNGDAAVFVDLGGIAHDSEGAVAEALCAMLGVAPEGVSSKQAALDHLRGHRALIVFDTCEGVVDAAARLASAIVASAPRARVLATSREALRAEGEQIYRIKPIAAPPAGPDLTAREAIKYPAVQLFVERVAASDASFEFDDQQAPIVSSICRELDGMALAIELAAGRVEAFGIQQVADQLSTEFALTWPGRRTAVPRQQTLRATLNWSHELLAPTERAVFRRLSVLMSAFPLQAALDICAEDAGLTVAAVVDALSSLVAKSLLNAVVEGGARRFRMLDATRSFARSKLSESGDERPSRLRQAQHYLARLNAADAARDRPAEVAEETANVSAVLNWAFGGKGDPSIGMRLIGAAAGLWVRHGLLAECRRWAPVVQAHLDSDPNPTDAGTRLILANALMLTDGIDAERRRETEAAYVKALKQGRLDERVSGLIALWADQHRRGRYVAAERLIDEADFLAAPDARPAHRLTAIWLRGVTDHRAGRHAQACEHLTQLLNDYTEASGHYFLQLVGYDLEAAGATILGLSEFLRGNLDKAFTSNGRAIAKARTLSSPVSLKAVLRWRALMIYFFDETSTEVDRLTREVLPPGAIEDVDGPDGAALATRGLWLARNGDSVQGAEMVRRGLTACIRTDYTTMHSLVRAEAALQLLRHGAGHQIDEFVAPLEHGGEEDGWSTPEVLRIRGEIAERRGDITVAEARYQESITLAERQGALTWRLRTAISLASLRISQGRAGEAEAILSPIYQQLAPGMASGDLRRAAACLDACRKPTTANAVSRGLTAID